MLQGFGDRDYGDYWVAVKELKLSYYIGETLLFTIYTIMVTEFKFLSSSPDYGDY